MNRKGNLLNGALLGSSGKSTRIFLQATQWCEAQTTSALRAGRYLTHVTGIDGVVSSFVLGAGRKLKAVIETVGEFTARLDNRVAVPLSAVSALFEMQTTAVLQRRHPVSLAARLEPLVTVSQGTLYKGSLMKSNCELHGVFTVILSESSRIRAPLKRISFISGATRISIIPGG